MISYVDAIKFIKIFSKENNTKERIRAFLAVGAIFIVACFAYIVFPIAKEYIEINFIKSNLEKIPNDASKQPPIISNGSNSQNINGDDTVNIQGTTGGVINLNSTPLPKQTAEDNE